VRSRPATGAMERASRSVRRASDRGPALRQGLSRPARGSSGGKRICDGCSICLMIVLKTSAMEGARRVETTILCDGAGLPCARLVLLG